MLQADTIIYDAQKIANYQADKRFDYDAQLDLSGYSWFELFARWFNRILNAIFSGKFSENVTTPILITLLIIALVTILYFLYKKRPELFMLARKTKPVPYDLEEENIHQINFDKELSLALDNRDYRLAIRLLYLQTLRFLSENNLIDWQIHKTPTEYLYEVANPEMKQPFRTFTNHFLHVRYGNYKASSELFENMRDMQTIIRNIQERRGK